LRCVLVATFAVQKKISLCTFEGWFPEWRVHSLNSCPQRSHLIHKLSHPGRMRLIDR
jgi:hypothetical protein